MSETLLSILMVAGVIVIAATIWLAVKTAKAKRTDPGAQPHPGRPPVNPQHMPAAHATPASASLMVSPKPPSQPARSMAVPANDAVTPVLVHPNGENGSDVPNLLRKAFEQLHTRQQRIDNELARIEQLRGEREVVAQQAAALDQAMRAFAATASVSHQIDPQLFETNGARGFKKL
jgi:hypothetical protein